MKLEFTCGAIAPPGEQIPVSQQSIRLFQMIEDRFRDALEEMPIAEVEALLERGAVFTASFRKELRK